MTNLFIIHYVVLELILQLVSNMYSYCHVAFKLSFYFTFIEWRLLEREG